MDVLHGGIPSTLGGLTQRRAEGEVVAQHDSNVPENLAGSGSATNSIDERLGHSVLLDPSQVGDDSPKVRPPLL